MAAHLAKWWKSKFLNGYKQFTAVVPSDTEELLGRHDYGAASEKDASQDKEADKGTPAGERRQLNFEEFECDVSVEGGVDAGGQERQEFSFTLYDFDGHGKITKDDIAGLVTTIYDTLGSSIKVPHYGSKTIKVKLTVSPEQRQRPQTESAKLKRDLNVTIRESRMPRRTPNRRRPPGNTPAPGPTPAAEHSCSSSCRSGASNNDDGAADVSEEEEEDLGSRHSTPKGPRERVRARRFRTQHTAFRSQHTDSKKRSSSLQREELLQIIQANMEKNNLCFQTSRKPCERGVGEHRHHRHRHKLHFLDDPRTNCYLDLAGLDASTGVGRCECRGHHRSRSHDLAQHERHPPPVMLDHTLSPHHLKHRNRQQDQARAMAQVVRWLEREFSTDKPATPSPTSPRPQEPSNNATGVEKHEHHHVHEHIHHHYHHYQDAPVLV